MAEDSALPLRKDGGDLMQESPASAEKLLDHLESQLTIRTK